MSSSRIAGFRFFGYKFHLDLTMKRDAAGLVEIENAAATDSN